MSNVYDLSSKGDILDLKPGLHHRPDLCVRDPRVVEPRAFDKNYSRRLTAPLIVEGKELYSRVALAAELLVGRCAAKVLR